MQKLTHLVGFSFLCFTNIKLVNVTLETLLICSITDSFAVWVSEHLGLFAICPHLFFAFCFHL
jgi:hypothetical protein